MRRILILLIPLLCVPALVACGSATTKSIPSSGTLLPNASLQISPNIAYTVEQIALAGLAGAAVYLVYDPLAPNWRIEESPIDATTYAFSLRAKHFRTGGDGEAMQVLKRRALELQRENAAAGYRILAYTEGIDSSTPLTRRVAEAKVELQPAVVK